MNKGFGGRNRTTAVLLALFLGWAGSHKFYLGKPIQGIFYILFCWTLIPSVVSLVEFIIYCFMSDSEFDQVYN